MRRYRRGARFVLDPLAHSTPLDRNSRARLLFLAESLERRTKAAGRRNGCLGYVGLQILKTLLMAFQNGRTGLCCPSYEALQRATGLCRASIAEGLKRLAAAGILTITRRIERRMVCRGGVQLVTTAQASNIYAFANPRPDADQIRPNPRRQLFPAVLRAIRPYPAPMPTPDLLDVPMPRQVTASPPPRPKLNWSDLAKLDWRERERLKRL